MTRSPLDYHSLEDGDLNRLWYEEQDPRARDAFLLRWWLGGDPIGGKDLLTHYHTWIQQRCFGRDVLREDEQAEVFRGAVKTLVDEFPADPIHDFEATLQPHVDRALDHHPGAAPAGAEPGDERPGLEAALAEAGGAGVLLRRWIERGLEDASADDARAVLEALQAVIVRLDGAQRAARQPLVATPEPPPQTVDASVATAHLDPRGVLDFAHHGGEISGAAKKHVEWCRACRERAVGALLFLRRARRAWGETAPGLPPVQPEFEQKLQAVFLEVAPRSPSPSANPGAGGAPRAARGTGSAAGGEASGTPRGPSRALLWVVLAAAAGALVWFILRSRAQ